MRLNFFNYVGGKHYSIKRIISMLDYSKKCYIELFGGSGKVLLNKPPHRVEIFNDIDDDIYNLFIVVRDRFDEFYKKVTNLIYCEKLFYNLRDAKFEDPIDKAIAFYYLSNTSFAGTGNTFGYSFVSRKAVKFQKEIIQELPLIMKRIKEIQILNRDYKRILESIKNKDNIMLYADPPYFGKEFYYKNCTFTKEDHYKLAEYLNSAKYSVLISYYYFDEIKDLYPPEKWNYVKINTPKYLFGITHKSKNTHKPKAIEFLVYNYNIENYNIGDKIWLDG